MIRLAINGYGRIGRSVLRALYEGRHRSRLQVAAINELADARIAAHLTRYDSTHGRFPFEVGLKEGCLVVAGDSIRLLRQERIADLNWRDIGIDVVLECTGVLASRDSAELHLHQGAPRVVFSQPALAEDVDATIVYGVNHQQLTPRQRIISAASCTTNGIVPVIKVLDDAFGIVSGTVTTIHSAMNDQPVLDAYHHTDLRKTRAAGQSIIPVDTALALGIERILPDQAGRFSAQALRVPTLDVSAMDLTAIVKQTVTAAEVNRALAEGARRLPGEILDYTEEPLASCDFIHDPHSSIVDAGQTRVSGGNLVKVLIWFDNEWGYANRMLDTVEYWCGLG